jgi:hypothetical protein
MSYYAEIFLKKIKKKKTNLLGQVKSYCDLG